MQNVKCDLESPVCVCVFVCECVYVWKLENEKMHSEQKYI